MNDNTNRATDAHLHELLYKRKVVFVASVPSVNTFGEGPLGVTSNFGGAVFTAGREWIVDDWLDVEANDVVPPYHESEVCCRRAELALAPELREDYAGELADIVTANSCLMKSQGDDPSIIDYKALYALITATAGQRAQALVQVLERARGEVGA